MTPDRPAGLRPVTEHERRDREPRESTSEMIDREIQRDQKIRGWLSCLPVLVAGCVSYPWAPRPTRTPVWASVRECRLSLDRVRAIP
jgi:hypothetical protein